MRITRKRGAAALVVVAALGLSACGSGGGTGGGGGDEPQLDNGALGSVVAESDEKGGTLTFGLAGEWGDTVDPGETYYGYSWDMLRNYARTLVMFKTEPGKAGLELTPDLATDLGKSSNGGKTWTYTLRDGVKMEDGSEITSADVKHAVLRSTDKKTFPNGPAYFEAMLDLPEGYQGPYKSKNANTDRAIQTPDDKTIVFNLKEPFAGFDYLAQLPQTAPVPEDKDTGSKYRSHPLSSGPYMFDGNFDVARGFTLKRNPEWDPATDPNRKALPDEMVVKTGLEANDLDNQIVAGTIDVDIAGTGVQSAALPKVLQQADLRERADNPVNARLWYTSINPTVKPLDNIECRKAVMYAMSPTVYQNAYGGEYAGGDIATTLMPPQIPGYKDFDLWGFKKNPDGQPDKAKEALQACGSEGFETNIAYRAERPKEKATAEGFQQALEKVGIKANPRPLPEGDYFSGTCGLPSYVVKNNIGLCVNGWGADWPDGYGFLSQIVDGRVIRETGGSSNTSVRIPEVEDMLDKAIVEQDEDTRNEMWGAIDERVMEEAVIYPGVYAKAVLLRSKNATNVFVNESFGYYDYTAMGVKQ
ncbi:ABC transporter substrate-binding protein [Marmoricola sp. Leaf446]|uniref:ABC transporter substrate-binding protein n=1 Tax=Marmoricola sp. Leaf446 TaxID=1736379 RepID=UPI0006F67D74|nr:ABC transporter substrate-binding protein [Marmoricola sp. Leaf446]KQT92147.1 ABC transporter substrate-binding protein [Marmoricola sp. Leaf446]